jgi:hypothetical protein
MTFPYAAHNDVFQRGRASPSSRTRETFQPFLSQGKRMIDEQPVKAENRRDRRLRARAAKLGSQS